MALNSISTLQKNRVYAPMILGLAIIVAIFVTRPAFSSYNDAKALLATTESELSQVDADLAKLLANKQKIEDPNSQLAKQVAKIAKEFDSAAILEAVMLNKYTTPTTALDMTKTVAIKDIRLDKGAKEPSGIHRGTVNLSLSAKDSAHIAEFLDYLTTHDQFAFSLNDITLPINTQKPATSTLVVGNSQPEEVSVSVTLGLYHYPDNK